MSLKQPWVLATTIAVAVVASVWLGVRTQNRDDLGFLTRMGGRQVADHTKSGSRTTTYEFDNDTRDATLSELGKRFICEPYLMDTYPIQIYYRAKPGNAPVSIDVDLGFMQRGSTFRVHVARPATWLERQIDTVEGWTHIR